MATGYTLDPQITALLEMGKDMPPLESMSAKEARDFYLASCAATRRLSCKHGARRIANEWLVPAWRAGAVRAHRAW